ncbi:23S rRNA (uracil(1939)-C(5))-methyltransferase RlmD [Pectobacterium sp. B1J-3]|uniref:23S rRNA (uracil(1939)-C(5))-methyltransferase RlmD n=1 Tax=Pectobacterium sp. B1J-3 TaxID=3385371 RepID=UPI0039066D65
MAQFYSPNRRVTTRQTLTVTVDSLDAFGQGVARHQGKTIFVTGALPGEQAEIQLTDEKRQFAHAKLKRILTRSAQRVDPVCPHFGTCGGCQQQHANIELQQHSKASALRRMMSHDWEEDTLPVTMIAGPSYAYRRRARLALYCHAEKTKHAEKTNHAGKHGRFQETQPSKQQRLVMGYRQSGSHDLVDINVCPILRPELESLLLPLRDCLSHLQAVRRLGHVELVLADNGPLIVLRHLDPLSAADTQTLRDFAQQRHVAIYLAPDAESLVCLSGDVPTYQIAGLNLAFSPRDFIQVNDAVNQQMVAQALAWLDVRPQDRILDLFCGMGNFTLPLAQRAAHVVGVEGVMALVNKGRENAQRNALGNVTFFHQNLEDDVTQQPWAAQGFDKILLDPARAGAAGVMAQVVKFSPQRVVYVSCNPTTLARDSKILLSAGYRLANLAMLDMFPHTGHLESMALFLQDSDGR